MIAELLRLLERWWHSAYKLFANLWVYFHDAFTRFGSLSLLELLQVLGMLAVVLSVIYIVFKLSLFIINSSLSLLKKIIKITLVFVVVLSLLYWITSPVRPCMFEAEAHLTNCNLDRLHDNNTGQFFDQVWGKINQWWEKTKP